MITNTFFENVKELSVRSTFTQSIYLLFSPATVEKITLENLATPEFLSTPETYPALQEITLIDFDNSNYLELNSFAHLQYLEINSPKEEMNIVIANSPLSKELVVRGDKVLEINVENCQLKSLKLDVINVVQVTLKNTELKEFKYISNSLKWFSLEEEGLEVMEIYSRSLEVLRVRLAGGKEVTVDAPLRELVHYLPSVERMELRNTRLGELVVRESPRLEVLVFETVGKEVRLELVDTGVRTLEKSRVEGLASLTIKNSPVVAIPQHSQ